MIFPGESQRVGQSCRRISTRRETTLPVSGHAFSRAEQALMIVLTYQWRLEPRRSHTAVLSFLGGFSGSAESLEVSLKLRQQWIAILGGYRDCLLHILFCRPKLSGSFQPIGEAIVDVG